MKTLNIMFTRGDEATQPGGIILREIRDGEFATHAFNRVPHTRDPKEFFWGHYFTDRAKALEDFRKRERHSAPFEISEGELIAKGDHYREWD